MKSSFYDDYEYDNPRKQKVILNDNKLTKEEIQQEAVKLIDKNVDNKNIFGYITRDEDDNNIYCKWNKENEVFVVYKNSDNKREVLQEKVKSFREYNGDKAAEYFDEI